jgi:hypothetical protein
VIPAGTGARNLDMTALLAVAGAIAMVLVIAAMVLLVPRGTQRLRRRRFSAAETQGAELAPEHEAS